MKRNKIWYLGYGIAAILVIILFAADLSEAVKLGLSILFAVIFSVSHTQILHHKMLKTDSDYRIQVLDERNIAIKEKAGNITNMITFRSDYFSSTNSFNFCQQSNRKENLINIIKEPPLEVPFVKKLF